MAIEHILTESDTLYSLAEQYLDDPNRWKEIADYNGLDAPYIVRSREEIENLTYGRGYLTVGRKNFINALIIPKGWTFKTKPYLIGGMVKTFKTTEDIYVPPGVPVFYAHVQSVEPGSYGNVSEGLITEPGEEFKKANTELSFVVNEKALTGGSDVRLLTVGDTIYIPSEEFVENIPTNPMTMLELIGGEDLLLEPEIGFDRYIPEDGFGDLKSVSGLENIKQAIHERLMTEKGELPLHPEYGTNLASIIGSYRTPYTDKLAEIEIYDALSHEDRIDEVTITRLEVERTTVHIDLEVTPSGTNLQIPLSLSLDFSKGGQ